jgi:hypothetical protein
MGNVFFDTDVNKTVDIFKTVDLTVTKDVFSFVDLTGNLATAEASADAVGGAGGGPGIPGTSGTFLIDDFSDDQLIQVIGTNAPNPVTGTAPGPVFPSPDAEFFDGTAIPDGFRFAELENLAGSTSTTQATSSDPQNTGQADIAEFNAGANSTSNLTLDWFSDPDGNGINDGDIFAVLPDCALATNATLTFTNLSVDVPDFVTLEFEFTDAQGDSAFTRSVLAAQSIPALEINLGVFTGAVVPPAGVSPAGGVVFVSPDADLDFDQITNIELRVIGAQAADVTVDDIEIAWECPPQRAGGNLAETDTFAQVTEDGAFSFSESLAAFDPGEADMIIT